MFTIGHLSDLRFGALTPAEAVLSDLRGLAPDLLVVSGNLTRRGSPEQFEEAKRFLGKAPGPQIVVPGAKDGQPLNLFGRFFRPFNAWRTTITSDLAPFFSNAEVAVLGINTARSVLGKKISVAQAGQIREQLGSGDRVTVLVSHDPLVPRSATGGTTALKSDNRDLHVVGKCVDLVLAGHQTVGGPQDSRVAYRVLDRHTIVAQASIAPESATGRDGGAPYYNAVRIDGDRIGIAVRVWRGAEFEEQGAKSYRHNGTHWEKFVDMPSDFQWTDSG